MWADTCVLKQYASVTYNAILHKYFFSFRIMSVTAVVLVIFILIYIREEDVAVVIPHLSASMPFFTSAKEETVCRCSNVSWSEGKITDDSLWRSVSWLKNTSTLQELSLRHPNLPVELLQNPRRSRCSLLPTIFRYRHVIILSKTYFYLISEHIDTIKSFVASPIRSHGSFPRHFDGFCLKLKNVIEER